MRVGANEAFVENATWQLLKIFLFERAQGTRTDLRGFCNFFQRHPTHLAFAAQSVAKATHSISLCTCELHDLTRWISGPAARMIGLCCEGVNCHAKVMFTFRVMRGISLF